MQLTIRFKRGSEASTNGLTRLVFDGKIFVYEKKPDPWGSHGGSFSFDERINKVESVIIRANNAWVGIKKEDGTMLNTHLPRVTMYADSMLLDARPIYVGHVQSFEMKEG